MTPPGGKSAAVRVSVGSVGRGLRSVQNREAIAGLGAVRHQLVADHVVDDAGRGDERNLVDGRKRLQRIVDVREAGDAGDVATGAAVVEKPVDRLRQVAVPLIDGGPGVDRGRQGRIADDVAEGLGELRPVREQHGRLDRGRDREVHQLGGWGVVG